MFDCIYLKSFSAVAPFHFFINSELLYLGQTEIDAGPNN